MINVGYYFSNNIHILFIADHTICILNTSELLERYNYPPHSAVSDLKVSPCDQYAACMVEIDNGETYTTHVIQISQEGDIEYVDVLQGVIRFGE